MVVLTPLLYTHAPGRDGAVRKPMEEELNVVRTYQYGNSTVHICDNGIVTNPEEQKRVMQKMYEIAWSILERAKERGEDV